MDHLLCEAAVSWEQIPYEEGDGIGDFECDMSGEAFDQPSKEAGAVALDEASGAVFEGYMFLNLGQYLHT